MIKREFLMGPRLLLLFGGLANLVSAQTITLAPGTEIAVRTIDRIDSKKASLSKEYAASLDDPIYVDGVIVVPANANAYLRVIDLKSAGFSRRATTTQCCSEVLCENLGPANQMG